MGGVFCPNCNSNVLLEQDGRSCSNCKAILVDARKTVDPPREPRPPVRPRHKRPSGADRRRAALRAREERPPLLPPDTPAAA